MTTPWVKAIRQRKLDRLRKQRLIEKAQKAHQINKLPEILSVHGWNKRFGLIQRNRGNGATE